MIAEIEAKNESDNRPWGTLARDDIRTLIARITELETALRDLYDGTAEYVYLNHLGDPHNTTPMRNAAKALGEPELFNYDRLLALTRSDVS